MGFGSLLRQEADFYSQWQLQSTDLWQGPSSEFQLPLEFPKSLHFPVCGAFLQLAAVMTDTQSSPVTSISNQMIYRMRAQVMHI